MIFELLFDTSKTGKYPIGGQSNNTKTDFRPPSPIVKCDKFVFWGLLPWSDLEKTTSAISMIATIRRAFLWDPDIVRCK